MLKFKITDPLNKNDTEVETYGCRASNSNTCKWNMLQNACAFVREDQKCKKPSRKWPSIYQGLLSK